MIGYTSLTWPTVSLIRKETVGYTPDYGYTLSKYFRSHAIDADKRQYGEKIGLLSCSEDPFCHLEQKGAHAF